MSYGKFARKSSADEVEMHNLTHVLKSDLKYACDQINVILPSIIRAGQSITSELVSLSCDICPELCEIEPLHEGLLSGFICWNAQTNDIHCEYDCSYTIIIVSYTVGNLCIGGGYVFEFECNNSCTLQIVLEPGTVLYYTGFGIMHCQISLIDKGRDENKYNFYNLSAYANQDLYSKFISTLRLWWDQ